MVIWVTFFINIGFLIYSCFGRAIELLGDFVLWIYGWFFFVLGVFLGFFGLWDWEFLDFVEESYI